MGVLRFFTWAQKWEFIKNFSNDIKNTTVTRLQDFLKIKPSDRYMKDNLWQPKRFRRVYHHVDPIPIYREQIAVRPYASVNKFDARFEKIRLACYILFSPLIMAFPLVFYRAHRYIVPDWLRYYTFEPNEYEAMHRDHLKYIEQCYIDYEEEKKLREQTINN